MKKEKQVGWRGFDAICACVLLIDHGQQPMKMHTEATLLYNGITTTLFLGGESFEWRVWTCKTLLRSEYGKTDCRGRRTF